MMEQSYANPNHGASEPKDVLGHAAAEFSKNVQEATSKLVGAAESFAAMSTGLNDAISEVKAASSQAQDAQRAAETAKTAAEDAKSAAEAVQANIARDYGNLRSLMSDLQERIGALAVLARPLSNDGGATPSGESISDESTENSSSGDEESAAAAENAPSPAGWQGWQG